MYPACRPRRTVLQQRSRCQRTRVSLRTDRSALHYTTPSYRQTHGVRFPQRSALKASAIGVVEVISSSCASSANLRRHLFIRDMSIVYVMGVGSTAIFVDHIASRAVDNDIIIVAISIISTTASSPASSFAALGAIVIVTAPRRHVICITSRSSTSTQLADVISTAVSVVAARAVAVEAYVNDHIVTIIGASSSSHRR